MEKEGFVYIWFDKKHKRYYIGCHWGTIDDGYICSSSWMKRGYKLRPTDFKRRIIKRGIERQNLLIEEHRWFEMIKDEELGARYYNLSKHHFGHWANNPSSLTTKEKISKNTKEAMNRPEVREKLEKVWEANKVRIQSEEEKQKRADSNKGQKRTEETKQKISKALTGKKYGPLPEVTKAKLSEALTGEKNPFYGKTHTKEVRQILSEKLKITMKGRKPSNIDQMKHMLWWNNGSINKRSFDCPGEKWLRGKLKKQVG